MSEYSTPWVYKKSVRIADRPDAVRCLRCVTYLLPTEKECPRCGTNQEERTTMNKDDKQ